MAARNIKMKAKAGLNNRNGVGLENMDMNVPTNTLKRHPKVQVDLNRTDLLRLLSHLEGELQARDISIAALKAEKTRQLLFQAKYGRCGLSDPFHALQRDSDGVCDNSFDENALKSMYDDQLSQLENLIATQRQAHDKMREQLTFVEKKYQKACAELEEEKRKHAQDTAQGDDVTYLLEKERERLKTNVDFEKSQCKKVEKELKKITVSLEEEKKLSTKHKQVAMMLIKERKSLAEKYLYEKQQNQHMSKYLNNDTDEMKTMAQGLMAESKKSLQMEAEMEKKISDFEFEREQLRMKLKREESRNRDLHAEIVQLKLEIDSLKDKKVGTEKIASRTEGPQSIEIKSSKNKPAITSPRPKPSVVELNRKSQESQQQSQKPSTETSPASPTDKSKSATSRISVSASSVDGTQIFSAPPGGKISLHMGPNTGVVVQKPVPPNKPAVPPKKDNLLNSSGLINQIGSGFGARSNVNGSSVKPCTKPIPPSKEGVTMVTKEKSAIRPNTLLTNQSHNGQSHTVSANTSGVNNASSVANPRGTSIKKPQSEVPSEPKLDDFLGREMADLQEILVSMATGESEASIDVSTNTLEMNSSPFHKAAASGNFDTVKDYILIKDVNVNMILSDSTTALHLASENGHIECVKLLLAHFANASACKEDKTSPLHLASSAGKIECVSALLNHGVKPSPLDCLGRTPLHLAAANGHIQCCKRLIENGANVALRTNASLTPGHLAIHSGHVDCLDTLLSCRLDQITNKQPVNISSCDVVNVADSAGWTVTHLSATKDDTKYLECIGRYFTIDIEKKDKNNRTILDLASSVCREYLLCRDGKNERTCTISIEIISDSQTHNYVIGTLPVTSDLNWSGLEERVGDIVLHHFTEVGFGLRTKKTNRFDLLDSPDGAPTSPYSLGLSLDSIKHYSIGLHSWSPGTHSEKSPYEILCNNDTKEINIQLLDGADSCQDSLAYETLVPISTLQNYLRLVEQYKSVVFYGPFATGKTHMAHTLAHCVQIREQQCGNCAEIYVFNLTQTTTRRHLYNFLIEKGCLIYSQSPCPANKAPIVILDDMARIDIAEAFGDLLGAIDSRGPENCVLLKVANTTVGAYYLHTNCYIIGTMDRSRSTGLELSVQQRFRWIHYRIDSEPTKGLLSRHLYRRLVDAFCGRLPSVDDQVYKAVEWIICVWQRLNEGLGKLGLPELIIGPSFFLSCPIEQHKSKAIIKWLSLTWNRYIAPAVCEAVIKGSGSHDMSGSGQQKVANTALYVLMQRAVVTGCPLTGQEKERYLASFHGSNELDIQMKSDKPRIRSSPSRQETYDDKKKTPSNGHRAVATDINDGSKSVSEVRSSSFSSDQSPRSSSLMSNSKLPCRSEPDLSIATRKKYTRQTGASLTDVSSKAITTSSVVNNNVVSHLGLKAGPNNNITQGTSKRSFSTSDSSQKIQSRTKHLRNEFFKDFSPPRTSKSPSPV